MATLSQNFDATGTPQALEDVLGLTTGMTYFLSNAGETPALFRSAVTQPADDARGHPLSPFSSVTVTPETGCKTWCWSRHPDGAKLIVSAGR